MVNMKKMLVGFLMIGMLAAVGAAGTFAYFSDVAQSTDNTIKAGTITFDAATKAYANHFSINNVKPDSVLTNAGTIRIVNDGSLPGVVTATLSGAGNAAMNDNMQVFIADASGVDKCIYDKGTVYTQPIGTLNANGGGYNAQVKYVFLDSGVAGQAGQGQTFIFNVDLVMRQV